MCIQLEQFHRVALFRFCRWHSKEERKRTIHNICTAGCRRYRVLLSNLLNFVDNQNLLSITNPTFRLVWLSRQHYFLIGVRIDLLELFPLALGVGHKIDSPFIRCFIVEATFSSSRNSKHVVINNSNVFAFKSLNIE